jgi:hypothetical protein
MWAVTGPVTNSALIRLVWSGNPAVTDASNVAFRIIDRITVTSPNTAVSWALGSTRQITWNHNLGTTQTVDIDVSADGGASWSSVATNVPNATATTGAYTWTAGPGTTAQALVRVKLTSNPGVYDDSDVTFTIATPFVTVASPNTAVTWAVGSTHNITWTHNLGTAESVRIQLSRNGGATYTETITLSTPNTANATGTFPWVVTGPPASACRVQITWVSNGAVKDTSNASFRIQ